MTKSELVAFVAENAELTKKDAEKAVNAVFAGITNALKDGDKVSVVGFGTFQTKDRPERTCTNPLNGQKMTVAATTVHVSKAGKALKDAVSK